ncbi:MAG: sugar ABC transporter ATP-binding protein [Thermomicrobiales bacterium]|nr:sugar ABC transporter ATP-binding protein [Thermomicrobiales bacterium]
MRAISKQFPGVKALGSVDLIAHAGEIHALVGENGAGKSTLMKVLSGAIQKDAGEVLVDGEHVSIRSPQDARARGIGIVYQEFSLVPALTVAENILLGRFPNHGGVVDRVAMERQARAALGELGVEIPLAARAGSLSIAQQQLVEIAKALAAEPKLLVLDEPSAVLGGADLDHLFTVLARLRERGISIIYISHRLEEVFRLADTVTVMRDGRVVETLPIGQLNQAGLVRRMVGRELEGALVDHFGEPDGDLLRVEEVRRAGVLEPISLRVRRGEIVGLAGLRGAGRTELARCIFGADPREGEVAVGGRVVPPGSPAAAIASGIGFVTEDRKAEGLILNLSVRENIGLAGLRQLASLIFIRRDDERRRVRSLIEQLQVRAAGPDVAAGALSGGNQQKVVLAKWLHTEAQVLLLDEPTRGVDVGAKREIYRLIRHIADRGAAVLMISSELPEVIGVCDRILVMHEGRLAGELPTGATEEQIMTLATGGSL